MRILKRFAAVSTNYGSDTVIPYTSPAVVRKYVARTTPRRFATTADLEHTFSLQPVT